MACKYYINNKVLNEQEIKEYISSNYIKESDIKLTTLGDIADILAYSNSKLILDGYTVEYTTPDNQKFKTYQEANKHISELARNVKDVDLDNVDLDINKGQKKLITKSSEIPVDEFLHFEGFRAVKKDNNWYYSFNLDKPLTEKEIVNYWNTKDETYSINDDNGSIIDTTPKQNIKNFIEKNKEYEQSKEIIEEWKKINNIQYNPEEIYSRGQEFSSVVGAYSEFDVNLMMQNLLSHIEDNEKAGGQFAISAYTKPVDRQIGHLEGGGGKIKFKLYPQSNDILWAANTDVYSGSVWDASEKVNKDKKSELLGVSYTKYPSLSNVNTVQPNLASIVEDLSHHHNELGITLTGNNFRLEYDEDIPHTTKKIINGINSILDQKYGKIVKPEIKNKVNKEVYNIYNEREKIQSFDTNEEAEQWLEDNNDDIVENGISLDIVKEKQTGIQPKITNETLKESIESVKYKVGIYGGKRVFNTYTELNKGSIVTVEGQIGEYYIESVSDSDGEIGVGITNLFYDLYPINEFDPETNPNGQHPLFNVPEKAIKQKENKEKEYTSQALINTKIAALKEVAKKYPRSLIRSEIVKITVIEELKVEAISLFEEDELPFQRLFESNNQESSTFTNSTTESNPSIKEGVSFVFEQNPELAAIGTQQQYSQYLDTIFPDSKVEETDNNLYISVLNDLKSQKIIDKDCNGGGKLKAEKGLQTSFTKNGEWKIIKDLKGYPTHKEGGVDLTISRNGVSIKNGNTEFTAKHGLVIPKN